MYNDPYHFLLIVLVDKFSRHLIIRIPTVAFKDNSHAGAFVTEVSPTHLCPSKLEIKF